MNNERKARQMGIPPRKLYRVGELVDYTKLSRQTIHNYTIMGLIEEADYSHGGHRLYDESVFLRLAMIDKLRGKMSLREIKEVVTRDAAAAGDDVDSAAIQAG